MTITQLALTYYALLPDFYWRYLYKHKVKSGAKISLQSFKDLYSLHRATAFVDQVKEWHRRLVFAPLHVMNPLSDLLQSRLLEDLRLAYARYFNLFLFRQSLDYHSGTPKGNSTIRVVSMDSSPPFTHLTISHALAKRTNMPRYIRTTLHRNFHIPVGSIIVKRLDKSHLQAIFSVPS